MRAIALAAVAALLLSALPLVVPPAQAAQDDAGSGGDAGGTFATATLIAPVGRYHAFLAVNEQDWYRFHLPAGVPIDIDLSVGLITGSLQVADAFERPGVALYDPNGVLLDVPTSNVGDSRVTWPRTLVEGEYRLQFDWTFLDGGAYSFCFVVTGDTCATFGLRPIELLTPLPVTFANVLLVPPSMANAGGTETPADYLQAALDGIHQWKPAIEAFTARHPQFSYLRQLEAHVEVFDGEPKRAGYDVVILWAHYTGPIFRGLASNPWGGGVAYSIMCPGDVECQAWRSFEPLVHDGGRIIVMSSFAAAPRAGQVEPDFPEVNDVYNVMLHEFAHTYGLGHTQTWTAAHGPDLMNSPYALVFGDGDPLGDGGERTPRQCINSLDLYGMARLYEWVGRGVPFEERFRANTASLPGSIPYEMYC